MTLPRQATSHWADDVHALFNAHRVTLVSMVPDAGHQRLIERCQADAGIRTVTLTTEEEGVALAAGAFLGGARAALLIQSSGVGNCVNMLSLTQVCQLPLVMLVTMRGEFGEFNPWQVPMGQGTPDVLSASGVTVFRVDHPQEVKPTVDGAMQLAWHSRRRVAVLLSQRLIGAKRFEEST